MQTHRRSKCILSTDHVTDTGLRPCTHKSIHPWHYLMKLGGCVCSADQGTDWELGPPTRWTHTGTQARLPWEALLVSASPSGRRIKRGRASPARPAWRMRRPTEEREAASLTEDRMKEAAQGAQNPEVSSALPRPSFDSSPGPLDPQAWLTILCLEGKTGKTGSLSISVPFDQIDLGLQSIHSTVHVPTIRHPLG